MGGVRMKYLIIAAIVVIGIAIGCGDDKVTFSSIPQADIDNPIAPPDDSTNQPGPTLPPDVIDDLDDVLGGIKHFPGLGLVTFEVQPDGRLRVYSDYFDFTSVLSDNGLGLGLDVKYLGNNHFIKLSS